MHRSRIELPELLRLPDPANNTVALDIRPSPSTRADIQDVVQAAVPYIEDQISVHYHASLKAEKRLILQACRE